jgi:hypothetical protein
MPLGQTKEFCMSTVEALYGGSPSTEKRSGVVARGAAKDGASSKEHRKLIQSIDAMVTCVVPAAGSITNSMQNECAYSKV